MGLRDVMRKAAGLLVELPPETAPDAIEPLENPDESTFDAPPVKTVEQIARDTTGPNLDEIKAPLPPATPATTLPLTAQGDIDFAAIYRAAALPAAPFSAEQMLELLASLPADLPLEVKRQTVKVTLGAMGKTLGASPESIVADASRKMAALKAYLETFSAHNKAAISERAKEILELQKQIEAKRAEIETARQNLTRLTQMCDTEADRLDDVLEFFSLDVPPSKYAPDAAATDKKPQINIDKHR